MIKDITTDLCYCYKQLAVRREKKSSCFLNAGLLQNFSISENSGFHICSYEEAVIQRP